MRSKWEAWTSTDGVMHFTVGLHPYEAARWNAERLAMLEDGVFLIQAAFRGETTGPLTLPKTGIPVRTGH